MEGAAVIEPENYVRLVFDQDEYIPVMEFLEYIKNALPDTGYVRVSKAGADPWFTYVGISYTEEPPSKKKPGSKKRFSMYPF